MPRGYRRSDGAITGAASLSVAGVRLGCAGRPGPGAPALSHRAEIMWAVCNALIEGKTLKAALDALPARGLPIVGVSTIRKWVKESPAFHVLFARARKVEIAALLDLANESLEFSASKRSTRKANHFMRRAAYLERRYGVGIEQI